MSTPPYVDPPEKPKTIKIGDYITVTMGDLIGKYGLILWAADEFIWLQEDTDLPRVTSTLPVQLSSCVCKLRSNKLVFPPQSLPRNAVTMPNLETPLALLVGPSFI
jgi:hypothetical protein